MEEQVFSFKETLRVILRRPRILVALGLVGLLAGLALALAMPAYSSAKTLLLLPPQGAAYGGVAGPSAQTDVEIASSATVLEPAAKSVGLKLPYATLQKRVTITSVTGSIIQIVAKSSSPSQAIRLANAVGDQFIAYSNNQTSLYKTASQSALQQQLKNLNSEIANVSSEIKNTQTAMASLPASSKLYTSDQQLVTQLNAELGNDNTQLRSLTNEINQVNISAGTSASIGVTTLQQASTATPPAATRFVEDAGIGLGIGLLIGLIAAFAVGRRDRKLRERDAIADAAGAPVIASVSVPRATGSQALLSLLDHYDPSVPDKAALRRLLDELGVSARHHPDGSQSQNGSHKSREPIDVSVMVIAGDDKAVAAAAEVPAFAAKLGMPVALVVAGSTESTQQLSIACAARDPLDIGAPKPNLLTYASAPGKQPAGVQLAVTVEVIDPVTIDVADSQSDSFETDRPASLLVVSAGYAEREEIEVVALSAHHRGRPLVGVLVADPDPSDKSSGQAIAAGRVLPGARGQLTALRRASR